MLRYRLRYARGRCATFRLRLCCRIRDMLERCFAMRDDIRIAAFMSYYIMPRRVIVAATMSVDEPLPRATADTLR